MGGCLLLGFVSVKRSSQLALSRHMQILRHLQSTAGTAVVGAVLTAPQSVSTRGRSGGR